MFKIDFDVTPSFNQLMDALHKVEATVMDDLRPYWEMHGINCVTNEMKRIFTTEGYGGWVPLSGKYKKWKEKHYPGQTILRLRDHYYRSLVWKRKNTAGNVYIGEPDRMEWGIDLRWFESSFGYPYPIVHEKGGIKIPIPARPIIPLAEKSDVLDREITQTFLRYMEDRVRDELKTFLE